MAFSEIFPSRKVKSSSINLHFKLERQRMVLLCQFSLLEAYIGPQEFPHRESSLIFVYFQRNLLLKVLVIQYIPSFGLEKV